MSRVAFATPTSLAPDRIPRTLDAMPTFAPMPQQHVIPGEAEYLLEDRFIRELAKLEPPWGITGSWTLDFLRRLDEKGDLRPRVRFRLPSIYGHWAAQEGYQDAVVELTPAERAHMADVHEAVSAQRWSSDPAVAHPLEVSTVLAPYREDGGAGPGCWDDHRAVVGPPVTPASGPSYVYHMRAAYAPWQLLRAWTLLESYTFRALLDPRTTDPWDVFDPGWAVEFDKRVRWRTIGDSRVDRVVELLSADGWLTALYRVRELVEWAWGRSYDPELASWEAGKAMTPQQRWDCERARLKEQCQELATPWAMPLASDESDDASEGDRGFMLEAPRHVPQRFVSRVRRMLELWRWTVEHDHPKLTNVVRADLRTVVDWAAFAYDVDFHALDRDVGVLVHPQGTSLAQALRPNRHAARMELAWWLEHSVNDLNAALSGVRLEAGDAGRFLEYLDACELWAWSLDLSKWTRRDTAADTRRDEGFLHLRSAALLLEPLLGSLAHDFGTDGDQAKIETGKAMQAFLVGRAGWRARVEDDHAARSPDEDARPPVRHHAGIVRRGERRRPRRRESPDRVYRPDRRPHAPERRGQGREGDSRGARHPQLRRTSIQPRRITDRAARRAHGVGDHLHGRVLLESGDDARVTGHSPTRHHAGGQYSMPRGKRIGT